MADSSIKPTFSKPISDQSKGYQKGFDKALKVSHVHLNEFEENPYLNEVDGMLDEAEQSLKKKIFSLAKMEALVFSDPKLAAIYEEMSENGEEKYGYHYNETIQNMIFNDYVLNSPKYLQKYKQAVPKEKKRRDKSGINQLKKKGEDMQTRNLEPEKAKPVLNKESEMQETTGTGGGASGAFVAPLGYKKVEETTTSASSGAYVGPGVWGSGDLMKSKGKANVKKVPMVKGGTIIQENYLTEIEGFERFFNELNESDDAFIRNNSDAFGSVDKMNDANKNIIKNDIKTGQPDKPNFKTMEEVKKIAKPVQVTEDSQSMIGDSPDTMANKPAPVGTQSSNMDLGARSSGGGMSEAANLLEEINNELKAFSIHQDKLKRMTEDRKPSSMVNKDRMGAENQTNFKKDLQHSGTKEIIDVEKELQWKDQQTEIGKDPMKLGADIEKKAMKVSGDAALKNVGDSTNEDGDEITKRNLTDEEQEEVNNYRLGLGDLVYDNKPSERFEDRMKADMGDKLYKERQDKLAIRADEPMYNKDPQPTQATEMNKKQFDKEKTGWNEREGLKESMVTGKYTDILGKKKIMGFNLNEVREIKTTEGLYQLNLEGLGNTIGQLNITENSRVNVNESVVKAINENTFYTNGTEVFVMKNKAQSLNESTAKAKPVVNEQMNKMKHLLGYTPDKFTDTKNTKKNRGF